VSAGGATPAADAVVKVGGALLRDPARLDAVLHAVAEAARERRLVVVPGGGIFADAVRAADAALRLGDGTAHWMAVLAMDQYAHLLAERAPNGSLVVGGAEIGAAHAAGRLPVLAPYAWLRAADPLPHAWEVTSDSIAAWVAGALGAGTLVLVKPAGAPSDSVDGYFHRALPAAVRHAVVPADRVGEIALALRGAARGAHPPR
jgi:aspartokinase-like uncharacterized kinase